MGEDDDFLLTISHVRKYKLCGKVRVFFFQQNGINWRDFVKNGISAKYVMSFNNPIANKIVAAEWEARKQ